MKHTQVLFSFLVLFLPIIITNLTMAQAPEYSYQDTSFNDKGMLTERIYGTQEKILLDWDKKTVSFYEHKEAYSPSYEFSDLTGVNTLIRAPELRAPEHVIDKMRGDRVYLLTFTRRGSMRKEIIEVFAKPQPFNVPKLSDNLPPPRMIESVIYDSKQKMVRGKLSIWYSKSHSFRYEANDIQKPLELDLHSQFHRFSWSAPTERPQVNPPFVIRVLDTREKTMYKTPWESIAEVSPLDRSGEYIVIYRETGNFDREERRDAQNNLKAVKVIRD